MTDSEKRAKEILEEYANYYSQVDLEQLTAKLDQLKAEAIGEFAERLKEHYSEYDDYDDIYVRHIRDDIDFLLIDMLVDYRKEQKQDEKDT